MLKTLSITLHNGKAGPESERLYIRCTEGPYYWTYHISHETRGECEDDAEMGERAGQLEDGTDLQKWWFHKINGAIMRHLNMPPLSPDFYRSLGAEPDDYTTIRFGNNAWTLIGKEMFDESRWTHLEN